MLVGRPSGPSNCLGVPPSAGYVTQSSLSTPVGGSDSLTPPRPTTSLLPGLGQRGHHGCLPSVWFWSGFRVRHSTVICGGLPVTLCHFLDGSTRCFTPPSSRAPHSLVLTLDNPPCRLWYLDIVRCKGLFPCTHLHSLVYCPSHFSPKKWITWSLLLMELLQLYQLPLLMDLLLKELQPVKGLPFENSTAPDLFASVFRQL